MSFERTFLLTFVLRWKHESCWIAQADQPSNELDEHEGISVGVLHSFELPGPGMALIGAKGPAPRP